MPLTDPVVAYHAETILQAHQVCDVLAAAGVPAEVVEDVSGVGVWVGGVNATLHDSKVYVSRADADRARAALVEYEDRIIDRRRAASDGPPVDAACEGCGKSASYPAALAGTVQHCPHCRAYVDVGEPAGLDGWDDLPPET